MNHRTASLCRSMMVGLSARGMRYTESEIAEFAIKHADTIRWASSALPSVRADVSAVVAKASLWWGREAVEPFALRLRHLDFQGDGDPVKTLYVWLQKSKARGRHTAMVAPMLYYRKTLTAVHLFIAGKSATKMYPRNEDIFEWLPGWEVPEGAPANLRIVSPEAI